MDWDGGIFGVVGGDGGGGGGVFFWTGRQGRMVTVGDHLHCCCLFLIRMRHETGCHETGKVILEEEEGRTSLHLSYLGLAVPYSARR